MAKRHTPGPRPKMLQHPAAAFAQSITISFAPQELQFLMQALRDLPLSGTPDSLAQVLPMIQGVRMKIASAGQALARLQGADGAPPEAVPPPAEKPAEKPRDPPAAE